MWSGILEKEAGVQASPVPAAGRSSISPMRSVGGVTSYLEVITAQNAAITDEVTMTKILFE
jgi:hypothetical protein